MSMRFVTLIQRQHLQPCSSLSGMKDMRSRNMCGNLPAAPMILKQSSVSFR